MRRVTTARRANDGHTASLRRVAADRRANHGHAFAKNTTSDDTSPTDSSATDSSATDSFATDSFPTDSSLEEKKHYDPDEVVDSIGSGGFVPHDREAARYAE